MRMCRQFLMLCSIALIATLGLSACNKGRSVEAAREDRRPDATPAEQDFMIKAALGNVAEIDAARLAMSKSHNDDVTDFANMIVSDHSSALEDLTDLMKAKGVSQPRSLSPEAKMDIEKLTALSGPEFDREFTNMMVADHQKAVEMFSDQLNIIQSPDVRKYIEDVLPKMEMHLEKAERLQSKLFGGGRK
jgi:putative membrane protein